MALTVRRTDTRRNGEDQRSYAAETKLHTVGPELQLQMIRSANGSPATEARFSPAPRDDQAEVILLGAGTELLDLFHNRRKQLLRGQSGAMF